MVAGSHQRGHPIEYNGKEWVYSDTKTTIKEERACIKCGRMPTTEGYDACLGRIEGATTVCCGHGMSEEGSQ